MKECEPDSVNQGTFEAALEISARRAATLRRIKDLFEMGKDDEAISLTKEFLQVKRLRGTSHAVMPRS